MALISTVIISNITNLSDARYCAGMGVEILGFNIDPLNNNPLTPDNFEAITGWVSGVKLAGEFQFSNASEIIKTCEHYPIDMLQISNSELIPDLKALDRSLILKIDVNELNDDMEFQKLIEASKNDVTYFLIDGSKEETCERWHPEILRLSESYPLILGCGISKENVTDILAKSALAGIALKGSEEIKPGYKDYDELADILEQLESDD